ncbi:L,D-transpeptidase family protein [Luteimonas deserti]
MPRLFRAAASGFAAMCVLPLAACATSTTPAQSPLQGAQQLVLVSSDGWDEPRARLQRYERTTGGPWRAVGDPVPVMLGRNGSAWGLGLHAAQAEGPQKREGDGRAPAGVFAIGEAFGYPPDGIGALPYRAMTGSHYCIDVPASPLYNRIVDAREVGDAAVAGSTEPMRLDLHNAGDIRYRRGFVIEHNAAGVPGHGSCIFAHLLRRPDETTAGCTAMEAAALDTLLDWLDPARAPRFVLLPEPEHARLAARWDLPERRP